MNIDFSTPMTFYELLAIILALIGILIPLFQKMWKNHFIKTKLNFIITGSASVYFNQSVPYIRIDGVFEAKNKSTTIKNMSLKVIRQRDDEKLNLVWSSFISPVNQRISNGYVQTTELAHPFKIELNSPVCAFTEFCDLSSAYNRKFKIDTNTLFDNINNIRNHNNDYLVACDKYKNNGEYEKVRETIKKDFFWDIGRYDLIMTVEFEQTSKSFKYTMNINDNDYKLLMNNIDESLLSPLKTKYGVPFEFYSANIELNEIII